MSANQNGVGVAHASVTFPKARASAEQEADFRKSAATRILRPARKDIERLKKLWNERAELQRLAPEDRKRERPLLRKLMHERPWIDHLLGAAPRRIQLVEEERRLGDRMHVLARHVDESFDALAQVETPRWRCVDTAQSAINDYLQEMWSPVTADIAGWGRHVGEMDAKRFVGDYPLNGRTVPAFRFRVVVTAHLGLPERYVVTTAYPMHPRSQKNAP